MENTNIQFNQQFTTLGRIVEYFMNVLNHSDFYLEESHTNYTFQNLKNFIDCLTDVTLSFHKNSNHWITTPLKSASSTFNGICNDTPEIVNKRNINNKLDMDFSLLSTGSQNFVTLFREPVRRAVSQLNHQADYIQYFSGMTATNWKQFNNFDFSEDVHNYPQCFFIPIDIDEQFVESLFNSIQSKLLRANSPRDPHSNRSIILSECRKVNFVEIVNTSIHKYSFILFTPSINHFKKLFNEFLNLEYDSREYKYLNKLDSKLLNIDIYDSEFGEFVKRAFHQDLEIENFLKIKELKKHNKII